MPYGQTRFVGPVSPQAPRVIPITPQQIPPLAPNAAERNAGAYDLWKSVSLSAADAAWTTEGVTVEFPSAASRLEVFAGTGDALIIGLDRTPSNTTGGYDLWHPGGGQLIELIPETRRIVVKTTTGAGPATDVHVIAHGGAFATRGIS
jgi:hypothetical protein